MGNFFNDPTEKIKLFLRQDSNIKLKEFILENNIKPNEKFTNRNRTLIQLCSYFDSPKCLSTLIELGNDINITEESTEESPLFIACKFNNIEIVKILLNQKEINFEKENLNKLNCLDISILEGNYEICYYLITNTTLKIDENSYEKYFEMNKDLKYPIFDMNLFYNCLKEKIPPNECPSFAIKNKKQKEFEGKVPDPNESWSDFIKRLIRLELYQPPLVESNKVDNMNSLYMKFQTSLCEREYNVKFNQTESTFNEINNNENIDSKADESNDNVVIKIHKPKNKSNRIKNEDLSKYNEKKNLIHHNFDTESDERKNENNNSDKNMILLLNSNKNDININKNNDINENKNIDDNK